jgi:replicative DNA helicase
VIADPVLYNETAERAVIGAVLIRNEALDDLADVLEPDHFGREHHRRIYTAIEKLHQNGQPIDLVSLKDALERAGSLEEVGGSAYVSALTDGVPRSLNALHYGRMVREKWVLRQLHYYAQRLVAETGAPNADSARLLESAEQDIYTLSHKRDTGVWVSGAEMVGELYDVINALQENQRLVTGIPSGFADVDDQTRGFQKGDLVLLGARPSQGKTALAMQIAMFAARSVNVAVFSIEMSRQPIGMRAVSALGQVDNFRLLRGFTGELDREHVSAGLSRLSQLKMFIDDSPSLSPLQVRSKLRRLAASAGPIGLVVIDYLQLMAPLPDHRRENQNVKLEGISRALKLIAREFDAPCLVLSQLNRGLERSADKRPTLADLRGSGALEQDADVVLLLHRPEVYEPDKPELQNLAELNIAKQRNGPVSTIDLIFQKHTMTFHDKAREAA